MVMYMYIVHSDSVAANTRISDYNHKQIKPGRIGILNLVRYIVIKGFCLSKLSSFAIKKMNQFRER
jgi:hypothetical protein